MEALNISHLTAVYPEAEKPVLRDVSFSLEAGEFAVLCGATGCGKTTLLRFAKRELTPRCTHTGTVSFCGTPVGALDARGFLIGPILAYELGKPLVLFRKQGKLPAELLTEVYSTEYGDSVIEVHKDSVGAGDSVLLVATHTIGGDGKFLGAKVIHKSVANR